MRIRFLTALAAAGLLSGCISDDAAQGDFYRAGFTDGCRSAEAQQSSFSDQIFRNEGFFKTEDSYRAGWRAGFGQCRDSGAMGSRPGDLGERSPY